jgi:prevent-host-death family protein
MKRLTDMRLLKGQTGEITMTEFRRSPGDVLDQVQQGKSFTITKNGAVVADLTPHEPSALELGRAARKAGIVR